MKRLLLILPLLTLASCATRGYMENGYYTERHYYCPLQRD